MILYLILIPLLMAYFATSGYVFGKVNGHYKSICKYQKTNNCDGECGHVIGAIIAGLLWPVSMPIAAGKVMSESDRTPRDAKRRTRELEEARHKKELARIQAETTAALERALEN